MINNKTRHVYTGEFKREAIELARTSGTRVIELERELGLSQGLLALHPFTGQRGVYFAHSGVKFSERMGQAKTGGISPPLLPWRLCMR